MNPTTHPPFVLCGHRSVAKVIALHYEAHIHYLECELHFCLRKTSLVSLNQTSATGHVLSEVLRLKPQPELDPR